jgi:CDP-glycerol glycerophosphotransferase (TagB/SpsB family)
MSPSLRDRARRGARGVVRRAAALRPSVTVVIEARGHEGDVRASLDSARNQPGRHLEILVVLVDERLRTVVEEAASGDWRVRVIPSLGADPGAARRVGADRARGSSLVFLPPRQELLPGGLSMLLGQKAGLVAGEALLAGRADLSTPTLARLLVPRETWLATEDDGEPAGQTVALRLLGGPHTSLPLLAVARDRGPLRPRPFEPQLDPIPHLAARIGFDETMLDVATDRATVAAGLLAWDLPPFLDALERCDDGEWGRLQTHTTEVVREAGAALADVPVEDRVLAWLAGENRREDLVAYVAARRFSRGQFPTEVRDGLIRAELGVADVPDEVLAVTEAESPLRVIVERVTGDGVVLWAGIAGLDEHDPQFTATVDGRPVEVQSSSDPAVTRWMGEQFQCHDRGALVLRTPPGETADVELQVSDRGVRRRASLLIDPGETVTAAGGKPVDLTDDEAGPYRQRLLQQQYLEVAEPLDHRLIYFQSFLGQSPTDHPGAIQEALKRVRPDGVRMLWCVADSSVSVPEGAEPVLLRSRAWYDAMARAAWIVTNVELEPWFRRREGQQVLETYHGYPSKAMGLSQWRARDLTPTHVEQMLRRTSGAWNNLLTPIPEMDEYYRENYAFEGRIISQGYPRQDALVAEGHEQRRSATRQQLGISPGKTAILYAPTWRDDLATNFRSAQSVLHLDVAQAARDLGPDHVVLLRGHRFHASTPGDAQVLDVTSYPEVNDLILAADAAVLDYSSLRFDVALAWRPMVFLVPDLREYTEQTRGFLYPFEDSAPGPLLETTAEVVDALRDLPALWRTWVDRVAAFNLKYNPLADGHAADRVTAEFFARLLED